LCLIRSGEAQSKIQETAPASEDPVCVDGAVVMTRLLQAQTMTGISPRRPDHDCHHHNYRYRYCYCYRYCYRYIYNCRHP